MATRDEMFDIIRGLTTAVRFDAPKTKAEGTTVLDIWEEHFASDELSELKAAGKTHLEHPKRGRSFPTVSELRAAWPTVEAAPELPPDDTAEVCEIVEGMAERWVERFKTAQATPDAADAIFVRHGLYVDANVLQDVAKAKRYEIRAFRSKHARGALTQMGLAR